MKIYQPIVSGSIAVSGSETINGNLIVSGSTNISGSLYVNNQQVTPGGASKGFAIAMAAAL